MARPGGYARARSRSAGPTARKPHFWLADTENGDIGGIDQLPAPLTINGVTKLPTFRYRGGDADGTDWDAWTYGETLTAAGSGGSFDQGTPWWGDSDYSVDPAGTRDWRASGNTFGDVTTEDIVVEVLLRSPCSTASSLAGKKTSASTAGWEVRTDTAKRMLFYCGDGVATFGPTSAGNSILPHVWNYGICFFDRSGYGQWYVNGAASGGAADVTACGTCTIAEVMRIGERSDGSLAAEQHIAYLAMYLGDAWLDTHLQATVAAERFQRLCGLWPKRALGTKAYFVFTRATTAVSDKVERGANLCTAPYDFSDAAWTATRVDAPTAGGVATPEGRRGWVLHEDDTANQPHYITDLISITAGVEYEFSVDAKAGNRDWLLLYVFNVNDGKYFDLSSGVVGSDYTNPIGYGIESLGDDWYRCRVRVIADASASRNFGIFIAEADSDSTFDGLDQDSFYIANASVKTWQRKFYSVGAGLPRQCLRQEATSGADFGGYLPETAATNLCTHSQDASNAAWTKTRCTVPSVAEAGAPDGTSTLNILHEDATAAQTHYISDAFTQAATTAYVVSGLFKANNRSWVALAINSATDGLAIVSYNLSTGAKGTESGNDSADIEDLGNGLFRCWLRDTRTTAEAATFLIYIGEGDADNTFDGLDQDSLYFWGAQIEANVDYPSSYIATSGATATRNADVCYYKGDDGNLGGVGSYGRGTMECEVLLPNADIVALLAPRCVELSDGGGAADRIATYILPSTDRAAIATTASGGSGGTVNASTVDIADGDAHTVRALWKTDSVRLFVDGSENGTEDTSADMPDDLDRINVGCFQGGGYETNGLIRNVRIWPYPHTHE